MNDKHSYTDGRYINPLTDFGFKKIFGDKEIMQAFLTDLLQPQSPITDITFIDKELPEEMEQIRGVIYDLHCRTADGKEFIVEMQNKRQQFFSDRIVYYLSRSVSSQVRRGKASWNTTSCLSTASSSSTSIFQDWYPRLCAPCRCRWPKRARYSPKR